MCDVTDVHFQIWRHSCSYHDAAIFYYTKFPKTDNDVNMFQQSFYSSVFTWKVGVNTISRGIICSFKRRESNEIQNELVLVVNFSLGVDNPLFWFMSCCGYCQGSQVQECVG